MGTETNNLELKPVESLYLLSLQKYEKFNAENALVAIISYLCDMQILSLKHGVIKLTKRGYKLRTDSQHLDAAESGVSWFIGNHDNERMFVFANASHFSRFLIKKGLIVRRNSIFSFFCSEFVLSDAGQEKVNSLIQMRDDIISNHKVPDISILSIFPSIHDRVSYKQITLIKSYVHNIYSVYQERTRFSWLKPSSKYL